MARYKDGALAELALTTRAEKKTKTLIRDEVIDKSMIDTWECPYFQRPVNMNSPRMASVVEYIKETETIPGFLVIGIFDGKLWKLDCQHRLVAMTIAGVKAAFAKVQYEYHPSLEAMAERFEQLNTPIQEIKRDDIYRCRLERSPGIKRIVTACPFVGFNSTKKDGKPGARVLRMSGVLRYWYSSRTETPVASVPKASDLVDWLDKDGLVEELIAFLGLCHRAWHSAPEYAALWSTFNMTLCMWLYRRICLAQTAKGLRVEPDLF